MFLGEFVHTIDVKGRVSIPAKFREVLGQKYDDRLVITNSARCLVAYPYEEWTNVVKEKFGSLSIVKEEVRAFQRFYVARAVECPIDKLGRILIPPTLRAHAQLEREVVFAGIINTIEIWNRERWVEEIKRAGENFEGMGDALAAMGV